MKKLKINEGNRQREFMMNGEENWKVGMNLL